MEREVKRMELNVLVYAEAWGFGGIESYLMGVFRALVGKGYRFTLFTTWDWCDPRNQELEELGIERIVLFKGCKPGQIKRLKEGTAAFRHLIKERHFDAVHVNTMNGMGLFYIWIAKKCGVPIRIAHSHNSDVGEGMKTGKRLVHLISRSMLANEATNRLACSPEAGEHLFGKKSFEIARNGIDTSRYSFDENKRGICRRGLGVSEEVLMLGNPSRLSPAKNPLFQLEVFSEVVKLVPSARYLMQGTGELEAEVRQHAAELGVANSIVWFNPRSNPEDLYFAMDAMLFPSLFEGLSLVSIEAQASGLPVLASKAVPRNIAITDLVVFEDLEAPAVVWAKKLIKIAYERRCRLKFASQIRDAGYDFNDTAQILATIYRGED